MSVIDAIIAKKLCGGGGSVPKPLTYDYMPEGYPKKTVQTTVLMEEQEVAFSLKGNMYGASLTDALSLVKGQTYIVSWDGTEYECVCGYFNSSLFIGNSSVAGGGEDSGEPFVYVSDFNAIVTFDTAPSHTISVRTTGEVVTTIAEKFLPDIPTEKLPAMPIFYTNGIGSTAPLDKMLTDAGGTPISYEQACAAGINVIIQAKSNPDDVTQFRPIKMQIFSSYVDYWVIDPDKNTWVLHAGSVN